MSFKRDMIDEIDGTSRLLVEVPIPGSDRFTYLTDALLPALSLPSSESFSPLDRPRCFFCQVLP